jgi:hypothetical protein
MLKKNIMKKIVLFLTILTFQLASCQTILPLNYPESTPNGAYLKDINNTYSKYLGTWEGVLNSKKYTFTFVKFTKHLYNWNANSFDYRDELMGKYKVVDLLTNTVVYDNTTAINFEDYTINSANPNVARGLCAFDFTDTEANCKNGLEFYLVGITGQPNKLRYTGFSYTDSWEQDNCIYPTQGDIPIFLPKQEFILTKLP